jgi:5-formaminoimidazole-4-carboxamide-1-beta-D-ribofuranosyl 5'-monophosphate synthetase
MYGDNLSFGQRIAMEINQALSEDKLDRIIT